MNIKEIEAKLEGKINTLNQLEYEGFLRTNQDLIAAQVDFYNREEWRRIAHMRHVSVQKRDSHYLNRFRELFGPPSDEIVIIWGQNYKQKKTFKKYIPTTAAESFKKLLMRNGY